MTYEIHAKLKPGMLFVCVFTCSTEDGAWTAYLKMRDSGDYHAVFLQAVQRRTMGHWEFPSPRV